LKRIFTYLINRLLMLKLTDIAKAISKYFIFAVVSVVLVMVAACMPQQTDEKGDAMALKGTIPPIDTSTPAQTETATFSLG
jgi:hypothetical protein